MSSPIFNFRSVDVLCGKRWRDDSTGDEMGDLRSGAGNCPVRDELVGRVGCGKYRYAA
jgi:hypothetical protein